METIAILGGGKIGEALLSGLLRGERTPADIVVVERFRARASYLADTYGVKALDVAEAAAVAQTLVVAVKPQDIDTLLHELAPAIGPDHLVVSVCAGNGSAGSQDGRSASGRSDSSILPSPVQ